MAFSIVNDGKRRWSVERDRDGYRTYRLKVLVRSNNPLDGPALALQTPGLPIPGQVWAFDNDSDLWCYCQMPVTVTPLEENGPITEFELEFTFSNKPDERRCKKETVEDPLLIPPEVSGGFSRFQEEAQLDRFGDPIVTSSHELLRGPHNEWDRNRPNIRIMQNVPVLNLPLLCQLADTVNAFPLWGLPPRTIKLSHISWQRKFYGNCSVYYSRTLEFDICYRRVDSVIAGDSGRTGTAVHLPTSLSTRYETWDRELLDEGTKALNGGWDASGKWKLKKIAGQNPDPKNPSHFCRYTDRDGNATKAILDGAGVPFTPSTNDVVAACGSCKTPVAKVWRMLDMEKQAIELTHAGDCTWTGTFDSQTYTLTFVQGVFDDQSVWRISKSGSADKWELSAQEWNCTGPNVLTTPEPDWVKPKSVRLEYGSQPGKISASVYGEADFLLLGIPTEF